MRSSRLQAVALSAIAIAVTSLPTPEVGEAPKLNTIEKRTVSKIGHVPAHGLCLCGAVQDRSKLTYSAASQYPPFILSY